jgi:processive 1,2-diacylglycerol beta-glucosyltransferase
MPRILILSASTGNGHMSAAHALERQLVSEGLEAKAVDTLDYTGSAFKTWYAGGYETCVRTRPEAWGHLYKVSDKPRLAYHFQGMLDFGFVSRTRRLLQTYEPDVVVCTHSLPQPYLAYQRKRLGFKIAVIVTDLYPHLMWLRGEPDVFFVATEWSKEVLESRNPTYKGRVVVTGIPVNRLFGERLPKDVAKLRLGLDPAKPVIMITVGGIGAGPVVEVCEGLASIPIDAQVVAISGRNKRLFQELQTALPELSKKSSMKFLPKGSVPVEEMALLMQASDFMIGKSGGLTTSEALAAGCPFVVLEDLLIPGQEFDNAQFLHETGSGLFLHSLKELPAQARELLSNPEKLAAMSSRATKLGRPDAVQTISAALRKL